MTRKKLPPLDYLRQCFRCDAEAGKLYWLERPVWMFADERICKSMNTQWAGKEAFKCRSENHGFVGRVGNVGYLTHRIIYYMATGIEPECIDHINGDRFDNRIANLRHVTHAENARNRARNYNSTTPGHGIYPAGERFVAFIKCDGRIMRLGTFDTDLEAIAARRGAERVLGFHENHGRPSRGDTEAAIRARSDAP